MTNASALVVRHGRFTLVVAVLLAGLLVIAAIGISVELHQAGAGLALTLAPQLLVLLAAYLVKTACDRWTASTVCLAVSAEGLMLPGLAVRPIPWTAVKSVRGVCCSPTPGHAATARQYVLFDVEAPESFGVAERRGLKRLAAPQPAGVPSLTLDLSELDAGKEAILAAVRRFHPAAVVDASPGPVMHTAPANDASLRLASVEDVRLGARHLRAEIAGLVRRRGEFQQAARDALRHADRGLRESLHHLWAKSWARSAHLQRLALAGGRRRLLGVRDGAVAYAASLAEALRQARARLLRGAGHSSA